MRTYVVGDIHAGLRGLEQVLERLQANTEDHFIFLGDYVDGWSTAAETIEFLMAFSRNYTCTFLRGNHDALTLDWLQNEKDNPLWLASGGAATQQSYLGVGQDTREKHIDFLESLADYYLDEQNRLFLHAGFTHPKGIDYEYFTANFYWDRTLWEMALSLNPVLDPTDKKYPARLRCYREIYIGHTPVTRLGKTLPLQAGNVWNVDTGAAFKGPLSIIDVDSKAVVQSDPVYKLYPEEQGRNQA